MEHVRIDIQTGNAAFEEDAGAEIGRILEEIAETFRYGDKAGTWRTGHTDINGNVVAWVEIDPALAERKV